MPRSRCGTVPAGPAAAAWPRPATAARGCSGGGRCAVLREVLDQGLGIGSGPFEEIEGDQPDGEQIGGEVRLGAHHLLGSEVTGCSDHVVGLGQPRLTQSHRDAEVGQAQPWPGRTGRFEQDVGGLDVTVHDPLRVHRGGSREELVEQGADERGRQRAVVVDQMDQGAPGHQIHGEQDLVVVGGPAGGREHMRVIDPQRLLPHEAQQRVRVALLEHLGGHVTAPPLIPGAPDRTDSPAADRVDQFVASGEDLTHGRASLPFGGRSGGPR